MPSDTPKRLTIRDFSRLSGFHRSTISRAFTPESEIRAATRDAVLKAAKKYGYSPHPIARAVGSRRTRRWGVLLPHLQNPFMAELVEELDAEARARDTSLIIGMSHYDPELETRHMEQWMEGETDGAIITVGQSLWQPRVTEQLVRRNFPVVFYFGAPANFPQVEKASRRGFEAAVRLLIENGHRRIGYVAQDHAYKYQVHAFTALEAGLKAAGIPIDEELLYFGGWTRTCGCDAWAHWRTLRDRPTAVLAFNDNFALGVLMAARDDGVAVPEELSVVGHDDIVDAGLMGLTTIRYDREALVQTTFDLLEQQQKGEKPSEGTIWLPTELIVRKSVGPAPV